MSVLVNRKMLGLAAGERSMAVAEVATVSGRTKVVRAAIFVYPSQADLDAPVELAKEMKQFLRAEGFSARRCVIGLEAKRLMTRTKTVPPGTDDESLGGILSIQAEREFTSDSAELVLDYAGPIETDQGRLTLLAAAPSEHVAQLRTFAVEAGLKPVAVASTTMTLADSLPTADGAEHLLLHLTPGGAELAVHSSSGVSQLRRLSVAIPSGAPSDSAGWLADLAGQLRREISMLPQPADGQGDRRLRIWNRAGLDQGSLDALTERISIPASICQSVEGVDLAGAADIAPEDAAVAACLGAAGLQGRLPGVDFLHPRLTAPHKRRLGRRSAWAAAGIMAIAAAGLGLLLSWWLTQRSVETLTKRLATMAPAVSKVEGIVNRTRAARDWHDRQPKYLECLRELTLAFPAEGVIWTTSLSIQDDMQMVFTGQAVSEEAVLDVLDRLTDSAAFDRVKQIYVRDAGQGSSDVSFAINAHYTGSSNE